jgi:hypothetical protein
MEKHQGRRPSNEELVAEAYRLIAESKCLVAERRRLLEMTRVIAARMEGSKSQQSPLKFQTETLPPLKGLRHVRSDNQLPSGSPAGR